MKIPCFHIDAFTRDRFAGNPASVCLLERWLDDTTLQRIAAEFNLSETAYIVDSGARGLELRWFTPTVEVDLCGHATLAGAYVLFETVATHRMKVEFHSRSGVLGVSRRAGGAMTLDFPSRPPKPCTVPPGLVAALDMTPIDVAKARDLLVVLDSEKSVRDLRPDMHGIAQIDDVLGVIVTAKADDSDKFDFVSRFFAPRAGIPEDPVTGSAHCTLTPYWATKLGKTTLFARQVSARGGELECELVGERVHISGHAVMLYKGEIEL